jgi:hypothetical protein
MLADKSFGDVGGKLSAGISFSAAAGKFFAIDGIIF